MNTCFSDVKTIQALTNSQLIDYKNSWSAFNTVEQFNSNVSTLRKAGNRSLNYYQFPTSEALQSYRKGLYLHTQYIGFSTTVQKN